MFVYYYFDKMVVIYILFVIITVINVFFFEVCLKVNYVDYLENIDRWFFFLDGIIKSNFDVCIENIVIF